MPKNVGKTRGSRWIKDAFEVFVKKSLLLRGVLVGECEFISGVSRNDLRVERTITGARVTAGPFSVCLSPLRYRITAGSRRRDRHFTSVSPGQRKAQKKRKDEKAATGREEEEDEGAEWRGRSGQTD